MVCFSGAPMETQDSEQDSLLPDSHSSNTQEYVASLVRPLAHSASLDYVDFVH